jgi:2-methylcitrate dehydratase PrpD
MGITQDTAAFVADTQFDNLPPETIKEAKFCLLDWLGVTLAGSMEPLADILARVIGMMPCEPQATVLGRGIKTSPLLAAMANGSMSHALDFDDYLVEGLLHPSAPLWAALLPVAEWKGTGGKDLITAFVLGFEVESRIAQVLGKPLIDACIHPTGTVGTFSAAVGAGKTLGLTRQQLINAIGMAGTQAAGLIESFGSMSKPFHAGKAAMNGLLAAVLAGEGFTGSEQMLDSERGFAQVLAKKDLRGITDTLGREYGILNNTYKPYPSCGATHAAIDTMLEIKRRYNIQAGQIKEVLCKVHPTAIHVAGKSQLKFGLEGKFSLKFCLSQALTNGAVTVDKFNESEITSPGILELMDKIRLIPEESYRSISEAEGVVVTTGGQEYRHAVSWARGTPRNPMSAEEMENKFLSLAELVIPREKAEQAVSLINRLDQLDGREVAGLVELCSSKG